MKPGDLERLLARLREQFGDCTVEETVLQGGTVVTVWFQNPIPVRAQHPDLETEPAELHEAPPAGTNLQHWVQAETKKR